MPIQWVVVPQVLAATFLWTALLSVHHFFYNRNKANINQNSQPSSIVIVYLYSKLNKKHLCELFFL